MYVVVYSNSRSIDTEHLSNSENYSTIKGETIMFGLSEGFILIIGLVLVAQAICWFFVPFIIISMNKKKTLTAKVLKELANTGYDNIN